MRIFCFYFSIRLGAIIAGIFGIVSRSILIELSRCYEIPNLNWRCNIYFFQFQNLIPESFLLLYGPEKLQAAAQDYQNHRQEYDAEKHFDVFVNFVVKCNWLEHGNTISRLTDSSRFSDPDAIITGSIIYVSVYVTIATLEIIGAYRVSPRSSSIPKKSKRSIEISPFQLNKWLLCPFIAAEAIRWIVLLFSLCIILVVLKKKINLGMLIGNSIAGAFILREWTFMRQSQFRTCHLWIFF